MKKEDIINLIKKRIAFHRKHFNRYRREVDIVRVMRYISKRNLSQLKYSDEQSGRELYAMDELELLLEKLEDKK